MISLESVVHKVRPDGELLASVTSPPIGSVDAFAWGNQQGLVTASSSAGVSIARIDDQRRVIEESHPVLAPPQPPYGDSVQTSTVRTCWLLMATMSSTQFGKEATPAIGFTLLEATLSCRRLEE